MAFDTKTNHGRVSKMIEFLDLIEKSAQSNGSSDAEFQTMLKPLLDRLPTPITEVSAEPKEEKKRVGVTAPTWASVTDMARQCSLEDLTGAMAVYLNRIDQEFSDRRKKK